MTTFTSPTNTGRRRPFSRPFNWRRAIALTLLTLAIAVSILPFYWVLRTALSSNGSFKYYRRASQGERSRSCSAWTGRLSHFLSLRGASCPASAKLQ